MATKFKFIALGIILSLISIFLYFITFRIKTIEENYANSLVKTFNDIVKIYQKQDKSLNKNALSNKFFIEVNKKYKNIALNIISDKNLSIKLISKNNKYIKTSTLYDNLLNDFTGGKFNLNKNRPFIIRYYDIIINNKKDYVKLYIFIKEIGEYKLLTIFPYELDKNVIIQISLEILLIIIAIIIIITLLYIFQNKQDKIENDIVYNINIDENKKIEDNNKPDNASKSLNDYVYDIFKKIYAKYTPEIISLYSLTKPDTLSKIYELKNQAFIKIESKGFDTIDINNEIGNELRRDSRILMNDGKKLILPIISDNSLLGIINIMGQKNFNGNEINDIKSIIKTIPPRITEFLKLKTDETFIDKNTTLFNESYFYLKYNELTKLPKNNNKDFSLIFISLFKKSIHIEESEKNSIIKIISPTIQESINKSDSICTYNKFICIILSNSDKDKALKSAEKLLKTLSKFRIKLYNNIIIQITPYFGISSSDIHKKEDMLKNGLKNIETALEKEKENIQI